MSDTTQPTDPGAEQEPKGGEQEEQTFTKADVNRIVKDRLKQQAENQFGDYADLKAKAEGAKTVEQQLAELGAKLAESETRALRSDIAAKHGISAEDRDLFLTGTDEATLTAQAERLAARDADRKSKGNVARKEGGTTTNGDEKAGMRTFVQTLFERADD